MKNLLAADLDSILDRTRLFWDELRGSNIFITGGTGFIGCWLLESFIWANDVLNLQAKVTVLTRSQEAFYKKSPHLASHPSISWHLGDVRYFEFPTGDFSHIIHAATKVNNYSQKTDFRNLLDIIVEGTRHTLDFAVACLAQKFLFTSSGAVYGKQPNEITHIQESYLGAPDTLDLRSIYGESKRVAELLCTIYTNQYGLETKIARCFALIGAYLPLDSHLATSSFFRDRLQNQTIQIQGDGTNLRSYLYASDVTAWLWTILFKGSSCYAYNVGSEEEISIADLAKKIAQLDTPNLDVAIAKIADPHKSIERYVPSTQMAKDMLGLQETVSLEDALQKTLTWYASTDTSYAKI